MSVHQDFIDDQKFYVNFISDKILFLQVLFSVTESDSSTTSNSPSQYGTTPEATKKSLFHHIIDAMQEDHHMIVVKDRPLSAIKTDLIHAFLSVC